MKRYVLLFCLTCAALTLAQEIAPVDAGTPSIVAPVKTVAGPAVPAPATPVVVVSDGDSIPLDSPLPFVKIVFLNVKMGNWWGAAAALLVLLVTLLRLYGRKAHAWLTAKGSPLDAPFKFLFDSRPGGWVLNILTAVGGGLGTALLAGEPLTWSLLKPILMVATTGSALWELVGDLIDWIQQKAVPPSTPPTAAAPTKP